MIKILANDGIHPDGRLLLEEADYEVSEEKIPQSELAERIGEFDVLIVRSATKVTKDIIDAGRNLKIIARGGVGLDNVDVEHAQSKGIQVYNTPAASSRAVAELAVGHMFTLARMLQRSNREMPTSDFKKLKKAYETGSQLFGKTVGIVGFGRIGQEVARICLGVGMRVRAHDPFVNEAEIGVLLSDQPDVRLKTLIRTVSMNDLLKTSDIISIHIPFSGGRAVITADEIGKMKEGVWLINTARGGAIDEQALLDGLASGKIGGAGLDVFENEPSPRAELLGHPAISVTPHIGANTIEAQSYIGMELADKILAFFGADK